jgi:TusA-related sulfurtransferase
MTGYFCPEPVIRVNEAVSEIEVGEVLELLADDPSSKPDIKSWTKRTGHELISIEENEGVFRFLIRRTA